MRKFKQVKRKEVIFDLNEWALVERQAKKIQINTSDYIRRMATKGRIIIFDLKNVGELMKGLRIIGGNINQIAKKANETHSVYADDVELLRLEVEALCLMLSQSIRATVQRSLAYILNPEKTDGLVLTSSLNCLTDPKGAYFNMKIVYEQLSGKKFNEPVPKSGKGRVKAIHYIQSFDPNDNISPELSHRIGKAFALKVFGKNSQVVIATHVDKEHIHTHFIVNTYGVNGHKFNDNKETLRKIREESDRVCLAFGIKPIKPRQGVSGIDHSEWRHKRRGTSWKEKIRAEIDRLMLRVKNVDELLTELECIGYTVKRGKYISVKAPDQQRAVRLKTLGEDYTVERLASRILWRDVGAGINYPCKNSELRNKYNSTLNDVQAVDAARPTLAQLGTLLAVINRDNLCSVGELEGKIKQLKIEIDKTLRKVNIMETKCNLLKSLAEQAEEYFTLMDKPTLTAGGSYEQKCTRKLSHRKILRAVPTMTTLKRLSLKRNKRLNLSKHIIISVLHSCKSIPT